MSDRTFLQLDYVAPSGETGQFEMGYRGDFNRTTSDYKVAFIEPSIEVLGISNPSNFLRYREHINAFYSQYGQSFDKFSF